MPGFRILGYKLNAFIHLFNKFNSEAFLAVFIIINCFAKFSYGLRIKKESHFASRLCISLNTASAGIAFTFLFFRSRNLLSASLAQSLSIVLSTGGIRLWINISMSSTLFSTGRETASSIIDVFINTSLPLCKGNILDFFFQVFYHQYKRYERSAPE